MMDGRQQFEVLHAPLRKEEVPDEASPSACEDAEHPRMAAYAAAHELGYTRAAYAVDLITGLLHGLIEAHRGVGGHQQ